MSIASVRQRSLLDVITVLIWHSLFVSSGVCSPSGVCSGHWVSVLGNWKRWKASIFVHVMTKDGIGLICTGTRCERCWHEYFSFSFRKLISFRMLFLCINELWLIIHELNFSIVVLWAWIVVIGDSWHHSGIRINVWLDNPGWDLWWKGVICSRAVDILDFINY